MTRRRKRRHCESVDKTESRQRTKKKRKKKTSLFSVRFSFRRDHQAPHNSTASVPWRPLKLVRPDKVPTAAARRMREQPAQLTRPRSSIPHSSSSLRSFSPQLLSHETQASGLPPARSEGRERHRAGHAKRAERPERPERWNRSPSEPPSHPVLDASVSCSALICEGCLAHRRLLTPRENREGAAGTDDKTEGASTHNSEAKAKAKNEKEGKKNKRHDAFVTR